MPLAAIYARKSTEQHVADKEKSVTRQIALATACANAAGFEVPPEHIYVDDAMSGAEFERRSGLVRLLNALHPTRHSPRSSWPKRIGWGASSSRPITS